MCSLASYGIGGFIPWCEERSSPVKNPAPYVTIQNLYDELEEAIDRQDTERIDRLRTEIRGEMAATAGWKAFADSAERNRMSDHTQRLLNSLGWRVTRIA
jgi:DNA-binding GntR family transcriptional regulator